MRTQKRKIVILIAAALLLQLVGITTVFAATGSDLDFDWRDVSDGNVAVSSYTGPGGAVQIPDTLSGHTVVQIDTDAFKNAKETLTNLSIPATISTISLNAFNGCTALTSVTFETGTKITTIPEGAFAGTGLTSIRIPASVTMIGKDAFKGCKDLASVTFETGKLDEIGEGAFSGTKLAGVKIPASVTKIDKDAFNGCSSLASLTFATGTAIDKIGIGAFKGTGLVSINIPESVTELGDDAFSGCASLQKVMIPGDSITFGTNVFVRTQKLDSDGVYGHSSSTAKTFCFDANIPYHLIDFAVGPTSFTSAISTGADRATLVWSDAERATGYELWRAASAGGTYSLIKDTTDTSYTNINLTVNTAYYYKVRGYCKSGGDTYYGVYSDIVTVKPLPAAPQSLSAVSAGYSSITLKWTPVTGMSGYEIYRAFAYDGPYTLVKTWTEAPVTTTAVTPKSYTFTGLTTGKMYYYKIRGIQTITTGTGTTAVVTKNYGAYSGVASAYPTLSQVKNLKFTILSPTGVKLGWDAVTGRTSYEVWRQAPGDIWRLYAKTTNNYYTNDRNIIPDQTYNFYVVAYRTVSGKNYYGLQSSTVSPKPTVMKITGTTAKRYSSTQINVAWTGLTGVSGYEVYWSTSASGPWTLVQTSSSKTFSHIGLTAGTTYYYRVRAYLFTTGGTIYGDYCDVVSQTP